MKPRIGITSGLSRPFWGPQGSGWRPYAAAVEAAGGAPVYLDGSTLGREEAVLAGLEGILFSGGVDIDLSLYPNPPDLEGQDPGAVMERARMKVERERDLYEIPLARAALERDMPFLGICRGCQLLTVALGGRLILDIPSEVETSISHPAAADNTSSRHALRVDPGSRLAGILDPAVVVECNSRHHQAVKPDEALPVRIAAVSPDDGIIEAVEVPGRRWAFGVQWHPERAVDPETAVSRRPLFEALVQAGS